jgi:aldehyde:ferredoxin oxidoreductase
MGRISVGAKSPLTLGIKEANSGGPAGQVLDRLGIRAIVVQGQAPAGHLYNLIVRKEGAELVDAEACRGMRNYHLVAALQRQYGDKIAAITTGFAGERRYRGASVSLTDIFGDPSRNAARGGLGAVMGSKGLKAVVLDPTGTDQVPLAHPEDFREAVRNWASVLRHDVSCSLFSGSAPLLPSPTPRDTGPFRQTTTAPGDRQISSPSAVNAIQKILFERGGKMHGCMPGCRVQCSIIYPDKDGKRICSAYEYETIGLLGTNLGITDNDAIARLKFLCDDMGLDGIETGSALGLAAEAGKFAWGDEAGATALLQEIEEGTPLGVALANGVVATARFLGIDRVPAYKGQALPAQDQGP